jgi:DNA polymerase elongation subunit (family B)
LGGIARTAFLHAKTMHALRYAWEGDQRGGHPSNETEVKGFQSIRSDWPPVASRLVASTLNALLDGTDPREIERVVEPQISAVARGEVPPMDVAIPKGLGKALGTYANHSPWDRGAQWANRNLTTVRFTVGSKPRLLYVKKVPSSMEPTPVICIEEATDLPEGVEVDWPLMAEKVRAAFDGIADSLGLGAAWLTPQRTLEVFP